MNVFGILGIYFGKLLCSCLDDYMDVGPCLRQILSNPQIRIVIVRHSNQLDDSLDKTKTNIFQKVGENL